MDKNKEFKVVSVDIGATSGRVMEVTLINNSIKYQEVSRFPNKVFKKNDILYWDIKYLLDKIFDSLTKIDKNVKSISISTWGCDICLIDEKGNLIDNPRCYRDEHNVLIQHEFEEKHFSYEEIYKISGIQDLPFNTVYQLTYLKDYEQETYNKINRVLMIPDYIAYVLTGKMRFEETNASTTSLYDATNKCFSKEILEKLKINNDFFSSPLIFSGENYGFIKNELKEKYKLNDLEIIACATHDTGSAVRGSAQDENTCYLSSGTWSLLGAVLDKPVINETTKKENYTNEIGHGSKIRFLKNIMGMWILEEYRRELEKDNIDNSFETILKEFNEKIENLTLIDPDDELFLPVGNMSKRINEYAKKTNQQVPKSRKEYIQTIYYSLAYKYRYVFEKLSSITNKKFTKFNIVGGGAKNDLLSQLVSDILQIEVIAGPVEATVLGNSIAQFQYFGLLKEDEIKNIVMNSDQNIKIFKPNKNLKDYYDAEYKKFITLMEVNNG